MRQILLKHLLIGNFSLRRIFCSAIFIYGCLSLYAFYNSDRMIFQPQSSSYQDDPTILKLKTTDGIKISAVFLPNTNATFTILYSHGNAEDLGDLNPVFEDLRNIRFSIFAYDYHGYGTSQGKPSVKNAYRDIDAAYDYLTTQLKISPQRIIALGRSVGSGPSTYLAEHQPIGGLILESAFISAFRVVIPFPLFPFDRFPNLKRLSQIRCPILVVHGNRDTIIPIYHGKKLYDSYQGPRKCLWVNGADHNNLFAVGGDDYFKAIQNFTNSIKEQSSFVN